MSQSVIGTIPPRLGGREPPQRVDPLSSWLGWAAAVGRKKVASIWLKFADEVAYG